MEKEEGLMFTAADKKTGGHFVGYLNPTEARIWRRLQKENPERYKEDPMRQKMCQDIEAELAKGKKE